MNRPRTRANGQGTLFQRTPDGPWIAQWFDGSSRRKRSTRTSDRTEAERILQGLVVTRPKKSRRLVHPDEWEWLAKVSTLERMRLYRVADQTGLKTTQLRLLKYDDIRFDAIPPFIDTPRGPRVITSGLAAELGRMSRWVYHPFNIPHHQPLELLLGMDRHNARLRWIEAAASPVERSQREAS